MLERKEPNVRASRTAPGTTMCCAVQHPGQTAHQTRGTTQTATVMPVSSISLPFSCGVVRPSRMVDCSENEMGSSELLVIVGQSRYTTRNHRCERYLFYGL